MCVSLYYCGPPAAGDDLGGGCRDKDFETEANAEPPKERPLLIIDVAVCCRPAVVVVAAVAAVVVVPPASDTTASWDAGEVALGC